MIGAAVLSLMGSQIAPAPPQVSPGPPPAADEMVVIGRRLATWRGRITPAGAALRCVTTRSSGDAEVDQIGCSAMVTCFTPLRARMEAASDRRRPERERRTLASAVERELGPCMVRRRDHLIAALAERRYQARQGTSNAPD